MQLKRTSRIVLSLTGQSIRYAKVHRAGQNVQVSDQKVLTFDFASFWSAPLTADNALSQLLKARGISRNKVIIGVPAQWCLFDEIRLPKLDQASLKSAVGLQAEQRYNRSDRAFTCDYMSPVADDDMWSVTLGAMAAPPTCSAAGRGASPSARVRVCAASSRRAPSACDVPPRYCP